MSYSCTYCLFLNILRFCFLEVDFILNWYSLHFAFPWVWFDICFYLSLILFSFKSVLLNKAFYFYRIWFLFSVLSVFVIPFHLFCVARDGWYCLICFVSETIQNVWFLFLQNKKKKIVQCFYFFIFCMLVFPLRLHCGLFACSPVSHIILGLKVKK